MYHIELSDEYVLEESNEYYASEEAKVSSTMRTIERWVISAKDVYDSILESFRLKFFLYDRKPQTAVRS